ncbi:MAG: DPP IV N-terminal domain-containing protein [Acidobacteriota bacterium]|nr:MAG: DPP IV N-terminal domain-containing protein [Acidobacteriota bacterium]
MRSLAVMTSSLTILLISLLIPVWASQAAQPSRLTVELITAEDASGRRPSQLRWSPDGTKLAYVWDVEEKPAIHVLDVRSQQTRVVIRQTDLKPDQEDDDGQSGPTLAGYHWAPSGNALLIEAGGDLYLRSLGEGRLRRLTDTESTETDPKFSSDGSRIAFVRDEDLHVIELATGEQRALTTDGAHNVTLNGKADWVYWEELWGRAAKGYWWSPDGKRLAFYRFDETPVRSFPLVDTSVPYPELSWQKYPKAGESNPVVRVGVLELETGETTWLDHGSDADTYLARVHWMSSSDALFVHRLNRQQNRLDLLRCVLPHGSCATLVSEEHDTWVNLSDDFAILDDGRFIWGSDRTGWRHLYLYGEDGKPVRALTSGEWSVVELAATSADGIVYVATGAGALGAAERQIYRVDLEGEHRERLSRRPGWNQALVAEKTGHWVHTWSDANQWPQQVVRTGDGGELSLPSEPPEGYQAQALPKWQLMTIPGPDGSRLPARMIKPDDFDPTKRYPAIMYHYGGPGSQVVVGAWGRGLGLWHKMMAQRGYVVLSVDNQASRFFGKKGEDRAHRRFGEVNLAAQLAGVAYLNSLGYVDTERVGLWGWSGGGTHTLLCLLQSPGTWRAGVSVAPVTDWRLYDSIWTERYLGTPTDNTEGYTASSPVTHAAKLEDKLLIVHGAADDNVHWQNTLVLVEELIDAGVPFEMAIYPRQKHGFRGKAMTHFLARMTEFFDRQLLSP